MPTQLDELGQVDNWLTTGFKLSLRINSLRSRKRFFDGTKTPIPEEWQREYGQVVSDHANWEKSYESCSTLATKYELMLPSLVGLNGVSDASTPSIQPNILLGIFSSMRNTLGSTVHNTPSDLIDDPFGGPNLSDFFLRGTKFVDLIRTRLVWGENRGSQK